MLFAKNSLVLCILLTTKSQDGSDKFSAAYPRPSSFPTLYLVWASNKRHFSLPYCTIIYPFFANAATLVPSPIQFSVLVDSFNRHKTVHNRLSSFVREQYYNNDLRTIGCYSFLVVSQLVVNLQDFLICLWHRRQKFSANIADQNSSSD